MHHAAAPSSVPPLALVGCLLLAAVLLAPASPAASQNVPVGDVHGEYVRLLETVGKADLQRFGPGPLPLDALYGAVEDTTRHPWMERLTRPEEAELGGGVSLTLADPGLRAIANTSQPHGQNEGALWPGRGLNSAVDAGLTLRRGPVELTFHPTLAFSQNRSFELAPVDFEGLPRYAYPWRWIDLPQRFGPDAFFEVDPGQSALRLHLGPAEVGVTAENLWWGPGIQNAILMSNNAPGFPHLYLATGRPLDIGIANVEARWIFGRLQQSDWFDPTADDRGRYITGAAAMVNPHFLEGLTVGAARIFYASVPEDGIPLGEYFLVFQGVSKEEFASPENPEGDDERSQMFALFWRWVFPESNTETWIEWARNDHGWNFKDYFLQPEHASAFTLGMRHVLDLPRDRLLSLEAELTRLEQTRNAALRDWPTYYAHSIVLQGYTQRGRVIGAGIGPGSSSQYAAANLYSPWGRVGLFGQRRVRDNDAYFLSQAQEGERDFCCHNVFLDIGAGALTTVAGVEVDASTTLTWETNRYFQEDNNHWNVNLRLSGRWRIR